jgi:adenosylcobinamide amidohydrolase
MDFSLEVKENYYIIRFTHPSRYISCAPYNGGFGRKSIYINRHVSKKYNYDPEVEVKDFLSIEKIDVNDAVVTLTSVDISKYQAMKKRIGNYEMKLFITAGFENAVSIGNMNNLYGTINMCLITDLPLSESASLNLIQSMVEAKAQCLNDHSIRDEETGKVSPGTSTDTVSLFILSDETSIKYGGRITEYGYNASDMVYAALSKIIEKKDR